MTYLLKWTFGIALLLLLASCKCDELLIDDSDTTPAYLKSLQLSISGQRLDMVDFPGEAAVKVALLSEPIGLEDKFIGYVFTLEDPESGVRQASFGYSLYYQCGPCSANVPSFQSPTSFTFEAVDPERTDYAPECRSFDFTPDKPFRELVDECDTEQPEAPDDCVAYLCPSPGAPDSFSHGGVSYAIIGEIEINGTNGAGLEATIPVLIAARENCVRASSLLP